MDDEVTETSVAGSPAGATITGTSAGEEKRPVKSPLELLNDPETLQRLLAVLGGTAPEASAPRTEPSTPDPDVPTGTAPTEPPAAGGGGATIPDGLSGILSDPAFLAKLPQMMSVLKPMLGAVPANPSPAAVPTGAAGRGQSKPLADCRDDLLLALKPFLSPERREAVDSILRISRLGPVLRQIR